MLFECKGQNGNFKIFSIYFLHDLKIKLFNYDEQHYDGIIFLKTLLKSYKVYFNPASKILIDQELQTIKGRTMLRLVVVL